jgi:hypothetical protein
MKFTSLMPSSEDSWTETKELFSIVNEVYLADAL